MKKENRIISILLMLCLLLTLAGCSAYSNPERYVTVEKYKGWSIERSYIEVSDETVENAIVNDFYDFVEFRQKDEGEIQMGDAVNVDYTLYIDGEPFSDKVAGYEFYVGSGTFIDGVDEKLTGAKVGDIVEAEATFPDDYQNELLAGKTGTFEITINHIIEVITPEFTDEFVAANSKYATYEELFNAKRENLEKENLASIIWEQVNSYSTVKSYPESMKTQYAKDGVQFYKIYAQDIGRNFDELIKENFNCSTEKQFEEMLREQSKESVGNELIVRTIAKREKITVSDEEYQTELNDNYAEYGFDSPEKFELCYGKNYIYVHLLQEKVLDFIAGTVTFF